MRGNFVDDPAKVLAMPISIDVSLTHVKIDRQVIDLVVELQLETSAAIFRVPVGKRRTAVDDPIRGCFRTPSERLKVFAEREHADLLHSQRQRTELFVAELYARFPVGLDQAFEATRARVPAGWTFLARPRRALMPTAAGFAIVAIIPNVRSRLFTAFIPIGRVERQYEIGQLASHDTLARIFVRLSRQWLVRCIPPGGLAPLTVRKMLFGVMRTKMRGDMFGTFCSIECVSHAGYRDACLATRLI
ncbi:hypothetical protein WL28_11555 [Burkholderia ubonensis]|nr:hypothetical protein WL28_11555 [Burkholderia ubonensis]